MFESPLETRDIGGAKSEFALAFEDEEPVGKLLVYEAVNYLCSAVGTAVVDDEDMEALVEGEHGSDDFLNVLLLVVRGYDNYTVAGGHRYCSLSDAKVIFIFLYQNKDR